ncbi:hypothetical protein D822_08340 [Streptococcus ratti FA-1 = DSM 20564]|uniref:Uncharacterized protein n=1 Tax=Streptococcus ratti FA-1 = DSM 20564 TaxID=699248 RepID=A0ABP2R182_STRRT|nr:hypothetical protein SRA_01147 [Streptococcus ratti FA-1 = DSM 20564]EMP69269.1 hypothetical protein D822_08340 [Streptococcus ratti FA-1 = DSM 20564]QEY06962.1 hypothetical protein FY406_04520 [Streptococcus ratti]
MKTKKWEWDKNRDFVEIDFVVPPPHSWLGRPLSLAKQGIRTSNQPLCQTATAIYITFVSASFFSGLIYQMNSLAV